jgi:hypothetical protein
MQTMTQDHREMIQMLWRRGEERRRRLGQEQILEDRLPDASDHGDQLLEGLAMITDH